MARRSRQRDWFTTQTLQSVKSGQVFDRFIARLRTVETFAAAFQLSQCGANAPHRKYSANLGFFLLSGFGVPAGASREEIREYARLMIAFEGEGAIPNGTADRLGWIAADIDHKFPSE